MYKLIVKGLGGQGAKTFVEILAKASNYEDKFYLAYPEFGPERSGTPINAYFKMDDVLIRDRSPIKIADCIVVLDKKLEKIDSELKKQGILVINSDNHKKFKSLDASKFEGKVNMIMLGAFIKATEIIKKSSIEKAIQDSFSKEVANENIKSLTEGYNNLK